MEYIIILLTHFITCRADPIRGKRGLCPDPIQKVRKATLLEIKGLYEYKFEGLNYPGL